MSVSPEQRLDNLKAAIRQKQQDIERARPNISLAHRNKLTMQRLGEELAEVMKQQLPQPITVDAAFNWVESTFGTTYSISGLRQLMKTAGIEIYNPKRHAQPPAPAAVKLKDTPPKPGTYRNSKGITLAGRDPNPPPEPVKPPEESQPEEPKAEPAEESQPTRKVA